MGEGPATPQRKRTASYEMLHKASACRLLWTR